MMNGKTILRTVLLRLRRACLLLSLFLYDLNKNEGVAVIMGVKNISDRERIINSLESIRNQDYDQGLIKITLVDYDSAGELVPKYREICERYGAEYIRVEDRPAWNRAHALNIGIKRARTKYILSTDVDIIFERNYIKEAVRELRRDPLQVVISAVLDLPDIRAGWEEYAELKPLTKKRHLAQGVAVGINLTLTYFYRKVRGYDEQYIMWGAEDKDLIERFKLLGLRVRSIEDKTSYLHQYHPKFRNVKEISGYEEQIRKNRAYFVNATYIMRNKDGWGES